MKMQKTKMVVNCPSCYKTHEIDQGSIQWECEACKIKIAKSLPAGILHKILIEKIFGDCGCPKT
jgi:ribosomal protein L37AE/L43A